MKIKNLLKKYDGYFYIYEYVCDTNGNIIDNVCIASHKSTLSWRLRNRKVHSFVAGDFCLEIYL